MVDWGRKLALGALGVLAAKALIGNRSSKSGETCVNKSICSGCQEYSNCGLPAALSRKRQER